MAPAIITLTLGGILIYSAVGGVGILDILKGIAGTPVDPKGYNGGASVGGTVGSELGSTGPTGPLANFPDSHAGPNSSGLVYPLAIHGKNIGGVAAHKSRPFGNWQSDNAQDIAVPMGTNVYAVDDGMIAKLGGHWDGTGQSNPNGYNVTLVTKNNSWFYTHLKSRNPKLKVGMHVKAGQYFGESGAANGVAHLHIGSLHGDPGQLLGV